MGLLDSQGRIVELNRNAFEFVHEQKDEVIGKTIWDLRIFRKTSNRDWLEKAVEMIRTDQKIYRGVFDLDGKENGAEEVELTLTPISVAGSDSHYIVVEGHRTKDMAEMATSGQMDRPFTDGSG
ncbi:MAG: PAS domain-containing protein [bacterium]